MLVHFKAFALRESLCGCALKVHNAPVKLFCPHPPQEQFDGRLLRFFILFSAMQGESMLTSISKITILWIEEYPAAFFRVGSTTRASCHPENIS